MARSGLYNIPIHAGTGILLHQILIKIGLMKNELPKDAWDPTKLPKDLDELDALVRRGFKAASNSVLVNGAITSNNLKATARQAIHDGSMPSWHSCTTDIAYNVSHKLVTFVCLERQPANQPAKL